MNFLTLMRPIQRQSIFKICKAKYVSQHPLKFIESQERYQKKDGLSTSWQLIYKGPMEEVLNYGTVYLTASTWIVGCGAAYYSAFVFDKETMNEPILLGNEVVIANNSVECLIYLGAFVIFHLAVKILLSKYVLRLYQDGDNYLAVFLGNWYNSTRKHTFTLNEFKKLNPTFVVSWGDARYGLGKKHGILLEPHFKTPEYLNYLLYKRKSKPYNDSS